MVYTWAQISGYNLSMTKLILVVSFNDLILSSMISYFVFVMHSAICMIIFLFTAFFAFEFPC